MAMAQVFLSYAREDIDRARALAEALGAAGISVWWDRVIPPGGQIDEVIKKELRQASCAIVLWSGVSARSTWVKSEANRANDLGILVPALLEPGVEIPMPFDQLHAADLTAWRGAARSRQLDELIKAVRDRIAARQPVTAHQPPTPGQPPPPPPGPGGGPATPATPSGLPAWLTEAIEGAIGLGVVVFILILVANPDLRQDLARQVFGTPQQPATRATIPPVPDTSRIRLVSASVVSAATGRPIEGAEYQLAGATTWGRVGTGGRFVLALARRDVTLSVRAPGYRTALVRVPATATGVTVRLVVPIRVN